MLGEKPTRNKQENIQYIGYNYGDNLNELGYTPYNYNYVYIYTL